MLATRKITTVKMILGKKRKKQAKKLDLNIYQDRNNRLSYLVIKNKISLTRYSKLYMAFRYLDIINKKLKNERLTGKISLQLNVAIIQAKIKDKFLKNVNNIILISILNIIDDVKNKYAFNELRSNIIGFTYLTKTIYNFGHTRTYVLNKDIIKLIIITSFKFKFKNIKPQQIVIYLLYSLVNLDKESIYNLALKAKEIINTAKKEKKPLYYYIYGSSATTKIYKLYENIERMELPEVPSPLYKSWYDYLIKEYRKANVTKPIKPIRATRFIQSRR